MRWFDDLVFFFLLFLLLLKNKDYCLLWIERLITDELTNTDGHMSNGVKKEEEKKQKKQVIGGSVDVARWGAETAKRGCIPQALFQKLSFSGLVYARGCARTVYFRVNYEREPRWLTPPRLPEEDMLPVWIYGNESIFSRLKKSILFSLVQMAEKCKWILFIRAAIDCQMMKKMLYRTP